MHKFRILNSSKLFKYLTFILFVLIEINTPQLIFASTKKINSIESTEENIQNDYYLLGPGDKI